MSHLKNNAGISAHLKRIFIYGDETAESHRVHAFLEFLSSRINPFTSKPYELGERSLYRHIEGSQHFPVDLLRPLVSWCLDERLMEDYGVYPTGDDAERLREKIRRERAALLEKQEGLARMEQRLKRPPGTRRKRGA